jgi:hypothetical protein
VLIPLLQETAQKDNNVLADAFFPVAPVQTVVVFNTAMAVMCVAAGSAEGW